MTNLFGHDANLTGAAKLSDCGQYRYSLTRWCGEGPRMCFIMLNPSTADAETDDPTIRRCIGFAIRERCGSIEVVNLFAFRATKPDDLWGHQFDDNDMGLSEPERYAIEDAVMRADVVVAAWGASVDDGQRHATARVLEVVEIAAMHSVDLMCLGTTKHGHPRHPLYVKNDARLVSYLEATE